MDRTTFLATIAAAMPAPVHTATPEPTSSPAQVAESDVFNVRAYGAVGDGRTDDGDAIQRAINAAGEGGHVHFPPGDYRFSAELAVLPWQRWTGTVCELGAGAASSTALTYTGDSGVGVRAAAATNIVWERLVYQNSALSYADSTFSTSGSTAIGLQLSGNITLRDCVIRLWHQAINFVDSNFYCKVFGGEFSRCETALLASTPVFNLELHGVTTRLVNVVGAGTNSGSFENLKALGSSFEGFRVVFDSLVDGSFFGSYFETDNDVDRPYGFFASEPPDDVSLHLFGCKIFMNHVDRFVNLSSLDNPTFVSIGNQIEVGSTREADGLSHSYLYAPSPDSGRIVMAGDTLHGRGPVGADQITYLDPIRGRQHDFVIFPPNDSGMPDGLEAYVPLPRVTTLANDSTPSVANGVTLARSGGTTSITRLDDGVIGQEITLLAEHSVTVRDGASLVLEEGSDFDMRAGDTLTLRMFNAQTWHETGRSVKRG